MNLKTLLSRKLLIALLFIYTGVANADEADNIPQKTTDPTASLPTIGLKHARTSELWDMDGKRSSTSLSVTNPFYAWGQHNLLNVTIPYNTGTGINSGEGATQIFDLVVFQTSWGRYGVGLDAMLNTPALNREGVLWGPALAFVTVVDKCNYGLLNLNYFSKSTSMSAVQLIAGCAVGDGWSISAGHFTPTYDWREKEFIEVPVSFQVGKVVTLWDQPIQFYVNPYYNTKDTLGTSKWTLAIGFSLVANPFNVEASR